MHKAVTSAPDAASLAALLQQQNDRRELLCSSLALAVKGGLIFLGVVSVVRLSMAYQERLDRHGELAAVVDVEANKLQKVLAVFEALGLEKNDPRIQLALRFGAATEIALQGVNKQFGEAQLPFGQQLERPPIKLQQ